MKCKAKTKSDRMRWYQEKMERKATALARRAREKKRPAAKGVTVVIPDGGAKYGWSFKSKWPKVEEAGSEVDVENRVQDIVEGIKATEEEEGAK